LPERLDGGELDLALCGVAAPAERFSDMRLFDNGFAAVVRRGHPAAISATISISALATYPNLILSSTGEETDFVDAELARHKLVRHITLHVPLLAAAATLAQSNMVAILSERTARAFAGSSPLQVLALPFASPRQVTAMLWHRRVDNVPAHQWLRSLILRVARTEEPA
jgi:DNA-binding transcriptional LysR family regulator